MTAGDVTDAIRKQNQQVAAGRLGQPPTPAGQNFQLTLNTLGRLETEEQFRNIVVKTGDKGSLTYLKDVIADDRKGQKGVELGAKNYDVNSYLDGEPSITIAIFQQPGSNALDTAKAIRKKMEELKQSFPKKKQSDGSDKILIEDKIVYDTTVFIDESIHEVYKTLFEAFILVFIVVLVFLQDWRATLMPMIDVPVSLIGTFAVMALLGFSLNNLSLFGLVLAIGIVVDDAIVVVENIERWMARGLAAPRGDHQGHGRDHRPGDRHHAGAQLGVHPDRVHRRHQRPVLQAVRPDHCRLDHHLRHQRHDDGPRPGRHPDQTAFQRAWGRHARGLAPAGRGPDRRRRRLLPAGAVPRPRARTGSGTRTPRRAR